jgi:hypothetical protein
MRIWQRLAEKLECKVADLYWIDDLWYPPAAPRLLVHLDNHEIPTTEVDRKAYLLSGRIGEADAVSHARMGYGAHITRVAYMAARPFRASREGEYIPKELSEPIKSETERSPINWDR